MERYKQDEDFLEEFGEIDAIGTDLAEKLSAWNKDNLDEENEMSEITPGMSGDEIISFYSDCGFEDKEIREILIKAGYSPDEDSGTDTIIDDSRQTDIVSERVNAFLVKSIEMSEDFPAFVQDVKVSGGGQVRHEEVRIIIKSDVDIRKLPSTDVKKQTLLAFLKRLREIERETYVSDEALFFCRDKGEFVISVKQYNPKA